MGTVGLDVDAVARSPLALRVGRGKSLFAVAIERGRARTPDVLYFGAETADDVRAAMVGIATRLPRGSRVVGVAPAIGFHHDEQGEELTA